MVTVPPSTARPGGLDPHRVVLTGFMGSGKTTVGRLLAARLGWRFADLDHLIEQQTHRSVPALFATHGEAAFRALERDELAAQLRHEKFVLALGGGAVEDANSRTLLRDSPTTAVVFLRAPFAVLQARCLAQRHDPLGADRPLFADAAQARLRFDRRASLYAEVATHQCGTESLTADAVVEAVLAQLALSAA